MYLRGAGYCIDCASQLGIAAQQTAPVQLVELHGEGPLQGTALDQRETFDDWMSLISLLSVVINLTR